MSLFQTVYDKYGTIGETFYRSICVALITHVHNMHKKKLLTLKAPVTTIVVCFVFCRLL